MHLWHLTPNAPREPYRVSAGNWVSLLLGSSPVELGQSAWVTVRADGASGATRESRVDAVWQRNEGVNSYWRAEIGPFADGDVVRYSAHGSGPAGLVDGPTVEFRVGPRLYVAILWRQHQPLYRDLAAPSPRGSYGQPWVRLHAVRDYYSMAHLRGAASRGPSDDQSDTGAPVAARGLCPAWGDGPRARADADL
jgi:hypothetical protein